MEEDALEVLAERVSTTLCIPKESIEFVDGTDVKFFFRTRAGPVGSTLQLLFGDDLILAIQLNIWFLVDSENVHLYDLCTINKEDYELLNELQKEITWGKLVLMTEDGTKSPMLTRNEALNTEDTLEEPDLDHIMEMFNAMTEEAVACFPIIATLSCGGTLCMDDVHDTFIAQTSTLQ